MSCYNESKTLALKKLASLSKDHLLSIQYGLKKDFYKKAKPYIRFIDNMDCLECDDKINTKIKLL